MVTRYRLGKASAFALLSAAAFALAGPAQAAAQVGTVTGSVTAASTGQPINGAQISIEGTRLGSLSNANGRYLITRIPAGTYTLQVVHVGYLTETRP
jgi:hypothetical protein